MEERKAEWPEGVRDAGDGEGAWVRCQSTK
jgi:hypothetical protein